jgi:hypothetical protein
LQLAVREIRMNAVYLQMVGFAAPGMPSWQIARAVLRGEGPYVPAPLAPHSPALLPMNERRRATPAVRLAFQAAEDAMQSSPLPAAGVATVFASSDADLAIIHRISTALASTPRLISPTDFHNSVHNAAAGYWHIATSAHAASSTVCAHDGTFAAGLLEACTQVLVDGRDTLLVAFDLPAPEPLNAKRPMTHAASVALLLSRRGEGALATLSCSLQRSIDESALADPALEALRTGNPATRSLPLLQAIARGRGGSVVLPATNGNVLSVEVTA